MPARAPLRRRTVTTAFEIDRWCPQGPPVQGRRRDLDLEHRHRRGPGTPTPSGRFWVRERLSNLGGNPAYGPFAFGTSAYSRLSDWPGGGVVGIHGTNQPGLIPGRPSHGCVRVPNGKIMKLKGVMPVGTPIWIHDRLVRRSTIIAWPIPVGDAHRLHPDRGVERVEVVEQRGHDPRPRHPERVPQRDRPAERVQLS